MALDAAAAAGSCRWLALGYLAIERRRRRGWRPSAWVDAGARGRPRAGELAASRRVRRCPPALVAGRPRRARSWRSPDPGGRGDPARGGHGRPRVRRVGQHGRRRPACPTRLDAAKAAATAFVERQPPERRSSASSRSATAACRSRRPPTTRPRCSPPSRGSIRSGARRSPRASAPPLDTIIGRGGAPRTRATTPTGRRRPRRSRPPVPPGSHTSGGHRPAVRRREHRPTPTPRGGPGRRRPGRPRSTPSASARPAAPRSRSRASASTPSSTRRCSSRSRAMTGGTYHHADSAESLPAIYDSLDAHVVARDETLELTAVVAGLGLALLMLGALGRPAARRRHYPRPAPRRAGDLLAALKSKKKKNRPRRPWPFNVLRLSGRPPSRTCRCLSRSSGARGFHLRLRLRAPALIAFIKDSLVYLDDRRGGPRPRAELRRAHLPPTAQAHMTSHQPGHAEADRRVHSRAPRATAELASPPWRSAPRWP